MRGEVQREPLNSRGVPTGGGEHATPLIEIGEQRDVALATAEARVVNADALNPAEILARQGFVDVVMDMTARPSCRARRPARRPPGSASAGRAPSSTPRTTT